MKRYQNWVNLFSVVTFLMAIAVGCVRNITVAPTTPGITNTHTFTITPIVTNTATNSPTPTTTNTATQSPTNSPVVANTNTATNSPTSTPTNSPIGANTNTATRTPTNSPTNSNTNTATNTPLVANTPTYTATPCNASSVITNYTFDSNISCWHIDASSSAVVPFLDISPSTTHTGGGSLHLTVNEPSSSVPAQIEVQYVPPATLTGATISAWIYVDPSLVGTTVQVFAQSGAGWVWDSGGWTTFTAGQVGTWVQVTWIPPWTNGGENSVMVQQIGLQFYNIPASSAGNIYVDDLQITFANTPTPTATNSPTATITNTPPPGSTPTDTPTNSPTNTPTPTPTTSACPLPLAAPYTFNTDIGCWATSNKLGTTTINWTGSAPAGSPSGGGALEANVTYSASAQSEEDFQVPLPANTDLTNKILTFNVYVDSGTQGTATYGGMQVDDTTTGSYVFCSTAWIGIPTFGAWHSYALNLSNTCTSNLTDVRAIGIQIFIGTGGGTGHIYIDDVTLTTATPPTNTPTPTGLGWTYEDATTQHWTIVTGTTGTGDTGAVTTLAGITGIVANPGANASVYGFDINLPAVPTGLSGANNDFQAECNSTSGSPIIGTGMDWSPTGLNLTSVTVQYWFSPSIGNYASTLYPYIRAGGGANTYGGTYGGGAAECNGTCPYMAANTWQTVTFSPTTSNPANITAGQLAAWATDSTNVLAVGVDINISSVNPFPGGDYVIDNITLQ